VLFRSVPVASNGFAYIITTLLQENCRQESERNSLYRHIMSDRNAEIWSTRLQKELLALTTETSDSEPQDVAGILPSFISLMEHHLDIAAGTCKVSFVLNVTSPQSGEDTSDDKIVIITLDASMERNPDGTINTRASSYPFKRPTATLSSGASMFPEYSTIQNGNPVDIDIDWTPSLHMTDAVLNIGLKVKESILMGEPFHPAVAPEDSEPVDELVKGARRFGSFLSKSAFSFSNTVAPPGAAVAPPTAVAADPPRNNPLRRKPKEQKRQASSTSISIGDEINLMEAPWVDCRGLYSCKAIRRPGFLEDAIALAAKASSKNEVAGAGFAGAGAMLRSFTQSARSLVEESFLMITDTHIIEVRATKMNLTVGTVTFSVPIDMMAKLKFRREESISLFFKPAPDDPLILMCPDSADAVHQIQSVLKAHGVKGKHTNAATQRAIHEALQIVQDIQAKERALEYQPSTERVNEIMDLYRQAAERFEVAGDVRHEEVVMHLRKFLALPLTASILDGSFKPEKPEGKPATEPGSVPEGEVLERSEHQLDSIDDDVEGAKASEKSDDKAFSDNIDNVLKEAKADLENLKIDDDLDGILNHGDTDGNLDGGWGATEGDDDLADLDAMLADADKELADLMAS